MKKKSVVLLSGGLDSTVNLYASHKEAEVLLVLTFNYGQKAFQREAEISKKICQNLNVPQKIIDLKWLEEITPTSLVSEAVSIPTGQDVEIDNFEKSCETAKAVWVPNRNGVFLNIAAAYAESLGADNVVVGFNKEEAQTFPDNSEAYLDSLNQCFNYSTANQVKLQCFTTQLNKTEIVQLAEKLEVNLSEIWPCYFSGEKICKQCESCKRFLRAIKDSGVQVAL
ncbi:MAG: 7-cyano-7-deazaguanine synthase QueC [Bdellovibrionales bacterium]|nr:7-cyano-7-deazaguanine synthase QueC [Bdellovibrionales bacterium]